jgi:hypothetical protein
MTDAVISGEYPAENPNGFPNIGVPGYNWLLMKKGRSTHGSAFFSVRNVVFIGYF